VISPAQRPVPDKTQQSQETDIHESGGIRTLNPNKEQHQTHPLDRVATGIDSIEIVGDFLKP